ncbi:E3 ubiquitin-protein ligase DTX3L [Stylophora pistillata]|uniref:E3 ubiquitin-protein ligase DTX3L n=1 Tax=Stylophora pistillata TaxID=50429 RepID=A0A2B4S7H1_STYPI|nr:E3 ubiquitin-protein ligase DTX3L [Stylophora pistillata]
MAAQCRSFLDNVKKELECCVCQEQFDKVNEPKILKCLHTFCKSCLQRSKTVPSLSEVEGAGLTEGTQGHDCVFTVITKDSCGNKTHSEIDKVTVDIRSLQTGTALQADITDSNNGCYTISYKPQTAGDFNVSVYVADEPIEGSPFQVKVKEKIRKSEGEEHPNSEVPYLGLFCSTYLPGNGEGQKLCELLRRAFDARLLFTIGLDNTIMFNDVELKTSRSGGPLKCGYPDAGVQKMTDYWFTQKVTSEEDKKDIRGAKKEMYVPKMEEIDPPRGVEKKTDYWINQKKAAKDDKEDMRGAKEEMEEIDTSNGGKKMPDYWLPQEGDEEDIRGAKKEMYVSKMEEIDTSKGGNKTPDYWFRQKAALIGDKKDIRGAKKEMYVYEMEEINTSKEDRTSETSQQDSVDTSQVNLCTADTSDTKPLTASEISALAFYAICFSVLKPCSYWNSDTLDAIVQFGKTFFIKTIKSQCSWALPENINILGAVNVNFVRSSNETLDETECSQTILNAAKEAKDSNLNIRDKLRKIGAAFLSTREVSSQECVYRCMPELWLRKVYPKTVFVSTDRMRPHTVPSMDTLCLAQFASHYYKEYSTNSETSDAQPEILTHDAIELHVQLDTNTDLSSQLPPRIKLINSNEIMKCRKIRAVVRYHTPNKTKEPENYFHHLLMLYYPSHNEDTQVGSERTYASKFNEPEVQAVVEENRALFEPDADAISEALEAFRNNEGTSILHSFDSLNDQENDDLHLDVQGNCEREEESFNKQVPSHLASKSNSGHMPAVPTISSHIQPTEISYDFSRGAGAGKSNLIKTIYHSVVKTLKLTITNTVLPTVLLMAPTGVSAINIDGTTINTALAIPKLTELTEIMRQKDDQHFAELLNKIRIGSQTDKDVNCINSRLISLSADNYPVDALHIWTENVPVNEYNNKRIEQLSSPLFILKANDHDQYPSQVTQKDINTVLSKARSDTGGLDFEIKIKEGARVMLTTNIDIADRPLNGQMGTAMKINVNKLIQKPSVIYIKFDDERAGNALIQTSGDSFAQKNQVDPIEPLLSKIKVHPGIIHSKSVQPFRFTMDDETKEIFSSIHNISPLKGSKFTHFDMVVQTKTDVLRAVCFSPKKHQDLQFKSNAKSPVKISNYKVKKTNTSTTILLNNTMKAEDTNVDFPAKAIPPTNNIASLIGQQLVTITAKVTQLGGTKKVSTRSGLKEKAECYQVYPFGSIKLILWESLTQEVQDGKTYTFNSLRVLKEYNTEKLALGLKTTMDSTTMELPDSFTKCTAVAEIVGINTFGQQRDPRRFFYRCHSQMP